MNQETNQEIEPLDSVIESHVAEAIRQCGGNITVAARKLKIGRATIYRMIRRMNGNQKGCVRV